jgi:hypothetical protein
VEKKEKRRKGMDGKKKRIRKDNRRGDLYIGYL